MTRNIYRIEVKPKNKLFSFRSLFAVNNPGTGQSFGVALNTVGAEIVEKPWAKERVSTGVLEALNDPWVFRQKV